MTTLTLTVVDVIADTCEERVIECVDLEAAHAVVAATGLYVVDFEVDETDDSVVRATVARA